MAEKFILAAPVININGMAGITVRKDTVSIFRGKRRILDISLKQFYGLGKIKGGLKAPFLQEDARGHKYLGRELP